MKATDIFNQAYERTAWRDYLGTSFGTKLYQEPSQVAVTSKIAKQVWDLGYIQLNDDGVERIIQVFEVELSEGITLERNRVGLRNLLRSEWKDIDGAFIVYHQAGKPKWRFSYVSELSGFDAEGNRQEIKTEPKRYTYVLGEGESTRTAEKRFLQLSAKGADASLQDILEAFSVEKLSKEFYQDIQQQFMKLVGGKTKQANREISTPACLSIPHASKETDYKIYQDFGVRILGRIVFCWFLKQKKFSNGDSLICEEILSKSAVLACEENSAENLSKNYYHHLLEPLFFETLNCEKNQRKYDFPAHLKEKFDAIPFLNGGLFEPHDQDFYQSDSLAKPSPYLSPQIPNQWFIDLFTILEQYNFTIDESSRLEAEVSIDPEILGRIFENLLAEINPDTQETARKSTGSFYTPREIVDYMVEQSLVEFFRGKFPDKNRVDFSQDQFLALAASSLGKQQAFCQKHPNRYFVTKLSWLENIKFQQIQISPRILLKLCGEMGSTPHHEIDTAFWKRFFSGETKIFSAFFGRIQKLVFSSQTTHYPSVHLIFEQDQKYFSAFFSPLLDQKTLVLNTVFQINHSRAKNYQKSYQKIFGEYAKKSWWEDADSLHQIQDLRQLSDKFSADLHQLLQSKVFIENKLLRVKFGGDKLLQEIENIVSKTPETSESLAKDKILEAIDELKIIDPACGSGAFPMGILQKIVEILQVIDPDNQKYLSKILAKNPPEIRRKIESELKGKDLNYARKLCIIRHSIFGVDIQPMAVEISRLRFFLSLMVDEPADSIQPLPNLEFNFVCADSLIPAPEETSHKKTNSQHPQLNIDHFPNHLKVEIDNYFTATGQEKTSCLKRIRNLIDKKINEQLKLITGLTQHDDEKYRQARAKNNEKVITEQSRIMIQWQSYKNIFENQPVGFFQTEYFFPSVKNGFDIVIGNPPYVSLEKIVDNKVDYKQIYHQVAEGRSDLYCLFYELGLKIAKENLGLVCLITSNKWMRAGYGQKLRGFFAQRKPLQLIDFGGFKVFESATVDTNILLIQNQISAENSLQACHFQNDYHKGEEIGEYFAQNKIQLNSLSSDTWFIGSQAELDLKKKIEKVGTPLKYWKVKINYGIKTGFNEAFIIDQAKRDDLIAADKNSAKIIKPILRGRDIKRYAHEWAGLWVINLHNGYTNEKEKKIPAEKIEDYPAVKKYLDEFWEKLKKRTDKGVTPYNLRNCAYLEDFEKEKIVYPNMTKFLPFIFDESGYFANQKCFIITGKNLRFLTGYFNSKIASQWLQRNCPELQGGTRELSTIFFENIPIPPITPPNQKTAKKIEALVDQILAAKKDNPKTKTTELERQIDELVYELYELTSEEIELVENSFLVPTLPRGNAERC